MVNSGDDDAKGGSDDPGKPAYWLRGLEEASTPFVDFEPIPLKSYAELFAAVLDSYGHRCALTGAGAAPADPHGGLEVAPLRPRDLGGTMHVSNFLCLSAEANRAFSAGYVSIGPDYEIIVDLSRLDAGLLTRFNQTGRLLLPSAPEAAPDPEGLEFHRERVFLHGWAG